MLYRIKYGAGYKLDIKRVADNELADFISNENYFGLYIVDDFLVCTERFIGKLINKTPLNQGADYESVSVISWKDDLPFQKGGAERLCHLILNRFVVEKLINKGMVKDKKIEEPQNRHNEVIASIKYLAENGRVELFELDTYNYDFKKIIDTLPEIDFHDVICFCKKCMMKK